MSSARAAINAALEAARSASRGQQPQQKRSTAQSNQAAQLSAAAQESAPARPAPMAAPAASTPAPAPDRAPPAAAGAAAPPWQTAGAPPAPVVPGAPAAAYEDNAGEPPSWVTEFSDDTAVAQGATGVAEVAAAATVAAAAPPAPVRAAPVPQHEHIITPVEPLDWDGNWPALAAGLSLRGVAQQLAFQTELVECLVQGNVATFRLRVPVDTLRASGNSEKLCAAVQACFPAMKVMLETEIGPVWYTASAEAQAHREACLRTAEQTVADDAFVQGMIRTFDAFVVPGSIKPAATS